MTSYGPATRRDDSERTETRPSPRFDVFLSYNAKDRPQVERIADGLRQARLNPWFDRWQLTPGGAWQEELHAGLQASGSCAYFIGPGGEGDWSRMELDVARSRAAKERAGFPVFAVLLPGLPDPFDRTTLPPFLSQRTWVDFRAGVGDRRALQALINAIKRVPMGAPQIPMPTAQPPYRGLQAFEEADAEFFFGRDADIQRMLEKLRAARFLAVLGPSGSGKSSLVRAGLIPALRRGAFPGAEAWPIRVVRPGALPLTMLATDLADVAQRAAAGVLDELARDERTLHLAAEAILQGMPADARACWVIDQAEELFTLCRSEDERAAFIANVAYAAAIPGGRTTIVLTMRADFYARLAAHPALAALVADSQYLVSPLDAEGFRAAIEEPAHLVALEFEEGLVETIVDDVIDRPGALPLLEHALLELWERRRGSMLTLEGYRESGGVEGALAKRAEEIFTSFSPEEQEIARHSLLRLTEPGEGTEDTRRRAPLRELLTARAEGRAVETVVNRLADARLLTVSPGLSPDDAWVDLSHEALIRGWPRVRAWIDEDREALRVHRRITEAAREWEALGRDPDQLYRGARLAEAVEWRSAHEADLNDLERAFLEASQSARDAHARAAQRRRRLTVIASLVLSTVLLVLASFALLQWQSAETQRAEADQQRAQADQQRQEAVGRQLAAQALQRGTPLGLALLLAAESQRIAPVDGEAALFGLLLSHPSLERILRTGSPAHVGVSPDGRTLASAGDGNTVIVWDLARGTILSELSGHTDAVTSVAFSPDGRTLASGSDDSTVIVWDLERGTILTELTGHTDPVLSVAFSPDGGALASASHDSTVIVWDLARGTILSELTGHTAAVSSVAFSPDGETLASAGDDNIVIVWDLASGTVLTELTDHTDGVLSVAFSPDGRTLASASFDSTVIVWDLADGTRLSELTGHTAGVASVAFSPDGRTLASAGNDSNVIVWDLAGETRLSGSTAHTAAVSSVAFSPDGRTLASGSDDNTVIVWDLADRTILTELTGHTAAVSSVAFSPDGRTLASAGWDNTIIVWDLARGTILSELTGHTAVVSGVAFSPDGRTLASAGIDRTVIVWDLAGGTILAELTGHTDAASSVAFSPDGRTLASAGWDSTVIVWDLADGTRLSELTGHTAAVSSVAFSPDGRTLASASDDSTVIVWDLTRGTRLSELTGHTAPVSSVAFSPDGRTMASGGDDTTVSIWDVDRDGLVDRACAIAGRNLTHREWSQYLQTEEYRTTCPEWPEPAD
jgi:WD40 repeat protein